MTSETHTSTAQTRRPGHAAADRMKLIRQQIEAHPLGTANIRRGKTVGHDYKNHSLSLMLYKRLCDKCPKPYDAIAVYVRPLA